MNAPRLHAVYLIAVDTYALVNEEGTAFILVPYEVGRAVESLIDGRVVTDMTRPAPAPWPPSSPEKLVDLL